ncbi:ABC transporter permease [Promicromonospora sp. NPDC057488]|uniref:ABC transporter permease n=1 Tax=Promicromonospora sp. NPDC057488 TaxID=3346147 RepID=UPI00366FA572
MSAVLHATRAELLRLRRWPAVWITVGAWAALALTFGYVFDYVSWATGTESFASDPGTGEAARDALLAGLLPQAVPDVLVQGMPMFGGALAMVLGALVAGNGFGWGTWKTAFTQGPSRGAVVGGSLTALSVFVALMVGATLVLFTVVSAGIALAEDQAIVWPTASATAQAVGGGLLVLEMWALLGYAVGILARGPALAVGLGLVWALVVENLLRGVGSLLDAVEQVTRFLPGTAAGSLVGALTGPGTGTPGVLDVLPGDRAVATVAAYVVGLCAVVVVVLRRRDLA